MKIRFLLLASVLIVITSCSKSANEDIIPASNTATTNDARTTTSTDAASTSGARMCGLPFKGSISYHLTTQFDLPCDCRTFTSVGTFVGHGEITHMGFTTSTIKPCASLIISGGTATGEHVGVECAIFRAANGDELYVHANPYDIMFTAAGPVGTADVDIIGGTGRFRHASGHFTGTVSILSATDATLTNINGTITY